MTAPELDLTAAVEATAKALFATEEPDRNAWRWDKPNPVDPDGPFAWHGYWLSAATLALQTALPHIREALAQQCATGRIVAAEFSDGIKHPLMGCEDCECQLHYDPPRPAGIYATIRFDDDRTRVGITRRVSMVEMGGES